VTGKKIGEPVTVDEGVEQLTDLVDKARLRGAVGAFVDEMEAAAGREDKQWPPADLETK